MNETDPTRSDPEQQDPESSAGADEESASGGEEQEGPATDKLDEDPAYNPEGTGLEGLKGG